MARVRINGQDHDLPDGLTVQDVLELVGAADRPAAVEINQQVVPRTQWSATPVREGDAIEIVGFVGGG